MSVVMGIGWHTVFVYTPWCSKVAVGFLALGRCLSALVCRRSGTRVSFSRFLLDCQEVGIISLSGLSEVSVVLQMRPRRRGVFSWLLLVCRSPPRLVLSSAKVDHAGPAWSIAHGPATRLSKTQVCNVRRRSSFGKR